MTGSEGKTELRQFIMEVLKMYLIIRRQRIHNGAVVSVSIARNWHSCVLGKKKSFEVHFVNVCLSEQEQTLERTESNTQQFYDCREAQRGSPAKY